ncbi:MAG: superoxide dismutase [Ni] [Planctomycetota bacterium]
MRRTRSRLIAVSSVLAAAAMVIAATPRAMAHCQVPCGIYGDELKFAELSQHIDTIEKSMASIKELAGSSDPQDVQQVVRWTNNKETHAQKIQDDAQEYFLAQRVKLPADESEHEAYLAKLASLHEIIVYAMKCKQTTDPAATEPLRASLAKFKGQYFGNADHTHHHGEGHDHSH